MHGLSRIACVVVLAGLSAVTVGQSYGQKVNYRVRVIQITGAPVVGAEVADVAVHKLLETRVYDISDLVDATVDPNTGKVVSYNEDDANDILQHIIDAVDPNSWHKAGGEGQITIDKGFKLMVLQTREVHQRIEKLLQEIRDEQVKTKPAIQIESRFLMVSEGFLEDVGLDANSIKSDDVWSVWSVHLVSEFPTLASSDTYSLILDDRQAHFLLRDVEAHKDVKMLAATKITVLAGKKAGAGHQGKIEYISGYSEPSRPSDEPEPKHDSVIEGIRFQLRPEFTPDNKNIILELELEICNFLGFKKCLYRNKYPYEIPETETVNLKTRISVPDGKTLLIGGEKITWQVERQSSVPILSELPFIGRFFRSRAKIKDQKVLLILVKPAIFLKQNAAAISDETVDYEKRGAYSYGYDGYDGYGGGYGGYGGSYGEDPNVPG
jgi:Flp pilus assembly secretin CpaC